MSTSLSTLRTKARRYIRESTADRWTDADLNAFVNEAIVFTQAEIEKANEAYFLRTAVFTAAAAATGAALPSDVYANRLRSVWCFESSTVATGQGKRVAPGQAEWVLENLYWSGAPRNYIGMQGYIMWAPMLQYDSTFRYVYSRREPALSSDNETLTAISDDYADIVAMQAALIALDSVNAGPGRLEKRLDQRLMQMYNDVQSSDPMTLPQVAID